MAKKKEVAEETMEELEEAEKQVQDMDELDDWDEEDDDDYEVDDSYEEAMRLEREARKKAKEEVMELAFKRDITLGIRKNYNFLLGYGTFIKILSIVGAIIVAIAYIVLAVTAEEPFFLIPAILIALLLMLTGYLMDAFLKWLAYILKTLHEINKKLK